MLPWQQERWCNTATYRSGVYHCDSVRFQCDTYCDLLPLHQGPLDVPSGCLLSGLELSASSCVRRLKLAKNSVVQGHRIELGELKLNVYTVVGTQDNLEVKNKMFIWHFKTHLRDNTNNNL